MSKPTLILQPSHNCNADIMRRFKDGKPLSADQLNFLRWHTHQLSSPNFDPVLQYYRVFPSQQSHTFLLREPIHDKESIELLKERLHWFLDSKQEGIVLTLSAQEFLIFQELVDIHELIYWHGNQLLTGAPFLHGGIPYVVYFQWGNLLGIVKYENIEGESAIEGNVLVYIEDMLDRTVEQCIHDYNLKMLHQPQLHRQQLIEQPILHTPVLSPSFTPDKLFTEHDPESLRKELIPHLFYSHFTPHLHP